MRWVFSQAHGIQLLSVTGEESGLLFQHLCVVYPNLFCMYSSNRTYGSREACVTVAS